MEGRKAPQSPLRHGGYWRFSDVKRALFLVSFSHSQRTVFISFKFYLHPSFLSYPYFLFFRKIVKKNRTMMSASWRNVKVLQGFFYFIERLVGSFFVSESERFLPVDGFTDPLCVTCWVFWFLSDDLTLSWFFSGNHFPFSRFHSHFSLFFHAVYTSGHEYLDSERASSLWTLIGALCEAIGNHRALPLFSSTAWFDCVSSLCCNSPYCASSSSSSTSNSTFQGLGFESQSRQLFVMWLE